MKKAINFRSISIISKIILWIGIIMTLSSAMYAICNLSNMDSVITTWAMLMSLGVAFTVTSIVVNFALKFSQKKHSSFPSR